MLCDELTVCPPLLMPLPPCKPVSTFLPSPYPEYAGFRAYTYCCCAFRDSFERC